MDPSMQEPQILSLHAEQVKAARNGPINQQLPQTQDVLMTVENSYGTPDATPSPEGMELTLNDPRAGKQNLGSQIQPTYAEQNPAVEPGQMTPMPDTDAPAIDPDVEINFMMTEPIPVSDVDGEGETDDDAQESEHEANATTQSSDPSHHADGSDNTKHPEQKVYIRLSNLKKHLLPSPKKPKSGMAKTKEVDDRSKAQTLVNSREGKREVKPKRFFDELMQERAIGTRPRKRARLDEDSDYVDFESHKRGLGFAPKKVAHQLPDSRTSPAVDEALEPSSPVSATDPSLPHRFAAHIPPYIMELYQGISGAGHESLDEVYGPNDEVIPWTAERLTLLYIYSYSNENVELCDLIADVWIRAFQERHRGRNARLRRIWLFNKRHSERAKYEDKFPDGLPPAPQWQHKLPMPTLGKDVTEFNPVLLNQLFYHTPKENGARNLWADAMALCGTGTERLFLQSRRNDVEWHEDLKHTVMCTSLRMARRSLTLKIEEVGETSWCARYHMHHKQNLPCYRSALGREQRANREGTQADAQVAASSTVGDEVIDLEEQILRGLEQAEDEDYPMEQRSRPEKHVQFTIPASDTAANLEDDDSEED